MPIMCLLICEAWLTSFASCNNPSGVGPTITAFSKYKTLYLDIELAKKFFWPFPYDVIEYFLMYLKVFCKV